MSNNLVLKRIFQRSRAPLYIAVFIGLLGIGFYLILSWGHAHGQASVIDEGLYLYKGLLFATGEYQPFQDFGPLTNHMPLSFLIPGYIQKFLGAGIRTGRMMALTFGFTMLIGLWLVTYRFAGHRWATAAVWAITLNSALIKVYSQAVSQVIVACMLVWVLVLVTGRERPLWQIILGVILSAALLFTRLNMAPVLPIVIMYIFWRHGKRSGFIALLVGILIISIGHAMYWPDILKLWAKWIPETISPFLDQYRLPSEVVPYWNPEISFPGRVDSLLMSLRMHFVSFVGFFGLMITLIFESREEVKDQSSTTAWLFIALFGVLLVAHAAASLGLNYCVYCLRNYVAFFSPIGLVLLGMFGRKVGTSESSGKVLVIIAVVLLVTLLLGFPFDNRLTEDLLSTDVTKIKAMSPQPGTYELSLLLENKLGLPFDAIRNGSQILVYALLAAIPVFAFFYSRTQNALQEQDSKFHINSVKTGLFTFLILQLALVNAYFSTGYLDFDCGENVIQANESVGEYLANTIPEGSSMYWGVGRSPVPLLYLPNRHIYPSQLNGDYTFMLSGDSGTLERFGYWNARLARSWLLEADYVLVEERVYSELHSFGFDERHYDEITRTSPANPCRSDSSIMIFRNLYGVE